MPLPPVQQNNLPGNVTNITFEQFNSLSTTCKRALHNGTDIIRFNSNNTITYFQTDGTMKVSYSLTPSGCLDFNYDKVNDKYYTVRSGGAEIIVVSGSTPTTVVTTLTGTAISPSDDFSTSGISGFQFDSSKWTESVSGSFIRSSTENNLVYNTSSGGGMLVFKATGSGNLDFSLDFNAINITGSGNIFGIQAQSPTMLYGVGVTASGGNNYYYKIAQKNFQNITNGSNITSLSLNPRLLPSGTTPYTVTLLNVLVTGTVSNYIWNLAGGSINTTFTGSATSTLTGTQYPINLTITNSSSAVINDFFSFDTVVTLAPRGVTSGTLNIYRNADVFSSANSATFDETISSGVVDFAIYGTNTALINVKADNFVITSGYDGSPPVQTTTRDILITTTGTTYKTYLTVDQVLADGTFVKNVVEKLKVHEQLVTVTVSGFTQTVVSGTTNTITSGSLTTIVSGTPINFSTTAPCIAVDPSENLYLTLSGNVWKMPITTPISGVGLVDFNTPGSGITIASGIVPTTLYSLSYNSTNGGFISYVSYDSLVDEVRIGSILTTTPATTSTRKIFLAIPDWLEHQNASRPYQIFQHGTDNNTQLYLRRHGTTLLNSTKVSGTNGSVASAGASVFTDTSTNFGTTTTKIGDLLILNKTSYASNGTYTITNINGNNLTVTPTISTAATTIPYTVVSNAALLQFNADVNISAFSAVNVDDFNLRAGTTDQATITTQVINAWGDPLNGKTVNYQLISGDGVILVPSSVTSGTSPNAGISTSAYKAGANAGTVQIQVTISD